jgi:formamidopyrimidine-DNA glycosylase
MPELPEVETVRRQIAPFVEGRRIVEAWADLPRITRPSVEAFVTRARGRRIEGARRRGKQMFFPLDNGEVLLIHLGMTGRLHVLEGDAPPPAAHVHGVLAFDDGRRLVFEDPRTFGELAIAPDLGFLARLGAEPLDPDFDAEALVERLRMKRTAIKTALLDQGLVAGLGNIYADEVCFLAGVHPQRICARISRKRLQGVVAQMRPVLERAIRTQGATARPSGRYYDAFGQSGEYVPHVYGRADQPCGRCGAVIRRAMLNGRVCHFCPRCQR